MQLNESDKQATVTQLADIFSTHSQHDLWKICEQQHWNVQQCIDHILTEDNQPIKSNTENMPTASSAAATAAENLPTTASATAITEATAVTTTTTTAITAASINSAGNSENSNYQRGDFDDAAKDSASQHGAIRKNNNENEFSSFSFANVAAVAASMPSTVAPPKPIRTMKPNNANVNNSAQLAWTNEYRKITAQIRAGHRIMVIMRGAPGSGKSTVAESLLRDGNIKLSKGAYDFNEFVHSTDNYFYGSSGRGQYKFNRDALPDAHEWNKRRVQNKAMLGWSPIIVDNTNTQIWEMMPYVQIAVQHGYVIELLEPITAWRHAPGKLAQRNIHGVPRESIQRMLERYEKTTVPELLGMLKDTKYNVTLPQMRQLPPIELRQEDVVTRNEQSKLKQEDQEADASGYKQNEIDLLWETYENPPTAKAQRVRSRSRGKAQREDQREAPTSVIAETQNVWQPYEKEAPIYWGQTANPNMQNSFDNNNTSSNNDKKSLLDLLRENDEPTTTSVDAMPANEDTNPSGVFKRHSINCANEVPEFQQLRQIYPNKQVSGLWDLYVKCNGDVDWAVDILLKEDELTSNSAVVLETTTYDKDDFTCNCKSGNSIRSEDKPTHTNSQQQQQQQHTQEFQSSSTFANPFASTNTNTNAKPQRQQRSRRNNPTLQSMKQKIENCFVLSDDKYSEHTRKIRDIRNGCLDTPLSVPLVETEIPTLTPGRNDDNDVDNDGDSLEDDNDLLEMDLGEKLVEQLTNIFGFETTLVEKLPEKCATNVFIPRTLAKQLYMLWMETAYNQMEEQRQQMLHEDEKFARLLKHPKYEEYKQSPNNVNELLDMELAWTIYNDDKKQQQQVAQQPKQGTPPNDLATQLTKMKLCEKYPEIPKDTVLDVFEAHGNSYSKTLEVLGNETEHEINSLTQDELIERAIRENELLNRQSEQQRAAQMQAAEASSDRSENSTPQIRDEAKRLALRAFEEARNLAAHHSQMKAECYHKAKQAMRHGNSGVAFYYSQIANLHKNKVDIYNHRAANCIMNVHKYTQNNPDLLDLHYLHVLEAIGCLDLFLDRHISSLRLASRPYKHIFIITGRGLHSAGGVSTIKNKVKSRLKERNLKWNEVNPGLLRVKIFPASRYAKSF